MADLIELVGGYNFEDRRRRAEFLIREVEPGFVPTPRPNEHHDEEEEDYEDEGDEGEGGEKQ